MNRLVKMSIAGALPLRALARNSGPVLTYHACYREVPKYVSGLDNITPEWLYRQVSTLAKVYRFVPIDEFAESKTRRGIAAITFDDGYRSVLDEAMPILVSLGVPFTIFVNTYPLEGETFWRHKVLYLILQGMASEFENFMRGVRRIPGQSLYECLKNPCNNSRLVESELDRFFAHKGLQPDIPQYMHSKPCEYIAHPLVWYGNHTHHHYVMASLFAGEQGEEIEAVQRHLSKIPGIQVSSCFALPFGRADQANRDTLAVVSDAGYKALLLNRGGVNRNLAGGDGPVSIIERFSVNESPIEWDLAKNYAADLYSRVSPTSAHSWIEAPANSMAAPGGVHR
jgi:peptidoglycan/xylan/chitin deacetylase (PgdA/CDA1 family)